MFALIKISWREVREGFGKFFLTLLSVSLGVAFLTGTLALRDTLASTFNDVVKAGITADLYVRGAVIDERSGNETRQNLDLNLEHKIRSVVGPDAVIEPEMNLLNVRIEDANGEVISNSGAPTILMPAYETDLWAKIVEGRFPRGPREVIMLPSTLESSGLKVGDTTTMYVNGAARDVTIVGSIEGDFSTFGAVLLFMERDVVEPLALPDVKKVPAIGVTLPEGADLPKTIADIAKQVPANAVVVSKDVRIKEAEETIETQLGFVNVFLLVFVFISLFIGSFVIANTFAMVVRQRMKQFAMLRAIGTRPRGIFFLVLAQAVSIGILGSLLGIVFGIGLLMAIGVFFQSLGLPLSTPTMSPTIMVIGCVVGLIVTIAGALFSARTAALTDPLDVLRNAGGADRREYTWRNYVGAVMLIIGIVTCWMAATQSNFMLIGVGATLVILGVLGSLAFMAGPVVSLAARLFRRIAKVETNLAVGNILRNRARTAATAGALTIGVALVIAGSMLSASIQQGANSVAANNLKADLFVISSNGGFIPEQLVNQIKDVDGVSSVITTHVSQAVVTRENDNASTGEQYVQYVDPDIGDIRTQTVKDGDENALANDRIIINQTRLDKKDTYKVDDEVTFVTPYGKRTAKVGAIVDAPGLDMALILPKTWIKDLDPEARDPLTLDIKVDDEADVETVKRDINAKIDDGLPYKANNAEEMSGEIGKQLDTILGILYALLALSVITAVFGIVNTLALSVMDRTREIGMSQAIGMNRRNVMGMITIESLLITLLGTVVGLITGVGLAWSLVTALKDLGIGGTTVPFGTIGVVIIGAIVVGIIAAAIPANRASKINVLSAMAE
ncbi:ABC transporter permease [Stomatohabitans albus]|uniref:ABC transporter permease n=1 Tax=Stomatohabitans albus TaxID=3110766 RepID=UPI00300C49DA